MFVKLLSGDFISVCQSGDVISQLSDSLGVSEYRIKLFTEGEECFAVVRDVHWHKQDTVVYDRMGVRYEKFHFIINDQPFVVYHKNQQYCIDARVWYAHSEFEVIHPQQEFMTKEEVESVLFSK